MKKSDIEIKYLMFDPWDEKTVSKLESYDEFKPDFGVPKQEFITYMILCYDLNTQLRKEVPYFNQRKIIAAELAGFKQNKDSTFKEDYENILIGENDLANEAISKYIRLFASPTYISLVYYWSILTSEFSNITASKSKDYKATIENISKLEVKINECTKILYGGDEVTNIRRTLYESVERENLKIRPEDIAYAEDIDQLIESPYGEYKPGKLKFISHK